MNGATILLWVHKQCILFCLSVRQSEVEPAGYWRLDFKHVSFGTSARQSDVEPLGSSRLYFGPLSSWIMFVMDSLSPLLIHGSPGWFLVPVRLVLHYWNMASHMYLPHYLVRHYYCVNYFFLRIRSHLFMKFPSHIRIFENFNFFNYRFRQLFWGKSSCYEVKSHIYFKSSHSYVFSKSLTQLRS